MTITVNQVRLLEDLEKEMTAVMAEHLRYHVTVRYGGDASVRRFAFDSETEARSTLEAAVAAGFEAEMVAVLKVR